MASLTQTGNRPKYTTATFGTTDLEVASTFRANNQYATRDADPSGGTTKDYTPGYDKSGHLTDDDTRTPSGYCCVHTSRRGCRALPVATVLPALPPFGRPAPVAAW